MQAQGYQAATQGSYFWCFIDRNGNILTTSMTGQECLGVTWQKYSQLEKTAAEAVTKAEEYYKILDEHHLIKRELTTDEKLAALTEQMGSMAKILEQQTAIINKLSGATTDDAQSVKPPPPAKSQSVITPEIIAPDQISAGETQDAQFIENSGFGKNYIASQQSVA